MDNLTELFCHVDDFCQQFEPEFRRYLLENGKNRHRSCCLELSEIMTLLILFHQLRYRQFKMFYLYHVCGFMRDAFPTLPAYNRFVELMPRAIIPMCCYLEKLKGQCSGISYIDSTKISVCHNKRIYQHKVFEGIAHRQKSVFVTTSVSINTRYLRVLHSGAKAVPAGSLVSSCIWLSITWVKLSISL